MNAAPELLETGELSKLTRVVVGGMESSAKALSEMTGQEIGIKPLYIGFSPLKEVPFLVTNPDTPVVGIYLIAYGEINGHIMLLFPIEYAFQLVDTLMGCWSPEGQQRELGEMETSALGEVGNITGSFFLTHLAEVTGKSVQPSPPAVIMDMAGAILDIVLTDVAQKTDKCLLIETAFQQQDCRIEGLLLAVPDPESLQLICDSLR
ncbi:MAG: chemotaxis protein CheC [Chloroflexi bacterium]|nr:chemotaxis protein CheC [Chloroflexota bacterium]